MTMNVLQGFGKIIFVCFAFLSKLYKNKRKSNLNEKCCTYIYKIKNIHSFEDNTAKNKRQCGLLLSMRFKLCTNWMSKPRLSSS